ncbi:hypothetical protein HUA78_38785 [Myxococcus sp. CA033]|uniref:SitI6 family double-CXXCG motif immunity protein n=1 Tax=Myxococcus sp. CA033 TaxID=2741516 RepID=UPI00157B494A|nr:double-CXXCG motif protein [Myxococcus sp. CA033]NTX40392.1 hypothetical protein [Myxococcus sp. CA033]
MRYFELRRSLPHRDPAYPGGYQAEHRWGLPGAVCPTCHGEWARLGLDYPAVDLTTLSSEREYRKARQTMWDEYSRLRDAVMPLLPAGALVAPGTHLGPLVGRARGNLPPVVLQESWRLLVHGDVLQQLEDAKLTGITPVEARISGSKRGPLYELALMPQGSLAPECQPRFYGSGPCANCGMQEYDIPEPWWMDATSPPSLDLVRFAMMPTLILASERCVEVLGELLPLSGVLAVEVPTTPPPVPHRGAQP